MKKTIFTFISAVIFCTTIFIFIHFFTIIIYSQVNEEWVERYDGPANGDDVANILKVDVSGYIYVTGKSWNGSNNDFLTIKYNSFGEMQWESIYNGGGDDEAVSITLDLDGNVYVAGRSKNRFGNFDYVTIKYDSYGIQQWLARYDGFGNGDDEVSNMCINLFSDPPLIYTTGSSWNGFNFDYVTIMYNYNGEELQVMKYDGSGNGDDIPSSISVDYLNNIFITGRSWDNVTGMDYATIKYNSSGVQQWIARYNGSANLADFANSIVLDGLDNVYVTGQSNESNTDFATVKYNEFGEQIWVRTYNGTGNTSDKATSIAIDESGNVYVAGSSFSAGTSSDYLIIKYDSTGSELWIQRYNGNNNGFDNPKSIALDENGNVYITGYSQDNGAVYDYATIKYDTYGNQLWVMIYNNSGIIENPDDKGLSIGLDVNHNVYVTGQSEGNGTGYDHATIKYSQNGKLFISKSVSYQNELTGLKFNEAPNDNSSPPPCQQTVSVFRRGLNKPIRDNQTTYDTIILQGFPGNVQIYDLNIHIDTVIHSWGADLMFYLKHLNAEVLFINQVGGAGNNFINTVIDDSSACYIGETVCSVPPFTGRYRPSPPATLEPFNYLDPNGLWILRIADIAGGDEGVLKSWGITICGENLVPVVNYEEIPVNFKLYQNYPNPFNPSTTIKYDIAKNTFVKIVIYNVLGQKIFTAIDEYKKAGSYTFNFDASAVLSNLASGIYFYRLETEHFTESKKMILLK